ncbi:hypothetical protein dsx2_2099 [Desulfovibrio sp. X2]|uniref:hypothetical protein n=1 Tax=Desulfovibrio sp. X2 TaxID=941449 RepID=UPI000358D80C|nr:hypothetical protein [Desulfovibrio sp. X2]EPR43672.1 hypothetical protein dsx2_2099 [Desulfovibrio sp. X2]
MNPHILWEALVWPLVRLVAAISAGLIVGNLIEALNWTRAMARVASPLIRMARLKDIAGASFSMAFFSGITANTMLAEAHERGELSRHELILANLFNALPTYLLHLPTVYFLTLPYIGNAAAVYVGLSVGSAALRTIFIIALGRATLPPLDEGCVVCRLEQGGFKGFGKAFALAVKRFKRRLPQVVYITVPVYVAFHYAAQYGFFTWLENYLSVNASFLSWLPPKAVSIIVFQMASQFTAGLAAAGALLQSHSLPPHDVVMALLVGNILSSPVRAIRHQFPYYAGIFKPGMAMRLIVYNQLLRVLGLVIVTVGYWFWIH